MTHELIRRILTPLPALVLAGSVLAPPAHAAPPETGGDITLRHVESVKRPDLMQTNFVLVSPDAKYVYSVAWRAMNVVLFSRDPESGKLEHVQSLGSVAILAGANSLCLSPDGRQAASPAFLSHTLVLFDVDPATGQLDIADTVKQNVDGVSGLAFATEAAFSTDSRFLYVVDDVGSMTVFQVKDGRLHLVETFVGEGHCLAGVRGLAVHPDGKTIFATSSRANALVVLDRDKESGTLKVRQTLTDEQDGIHGLQGAMRVVCSADGKFVYTTSGRLRGDNAVGAYRVGDDGRLSLLQEFFGGGGEVRDFVGGNHLALSPDGLNLYATATQSGSLAVFKRDPESGKLTYLETLKDDDVDGRFGGAACVAVSPDSRFVYVAAAAEGAVTVLRREPRP